MFRDRPLTWLFILATIVVDLAMFFGGQRQVFESIVLGQVAAIAIWAAIGQSHRLTRGSLLVVVVGVLAILPGNGNLTGYSQDLTFMAAYALVVVLTSMVVVWLRNQVRIRFESDYEKAQLKVPLIEFFGWTIVVAIASFGTRNMDIRVLEAVLQSPSLTLKIYAVAPLALILFDLRFQTLHLVKAVLFVGGVYLTASFLQSEMGFDVMITSVASYLTAWLLVRSIEYDHLKSVGENAGEIKLFDADD